MQRRTFLAATTWLGASAVVAQPTEYPTAPVRIIVSFAAGGPADLVARTLGAKLGDSLGQSVVIESRDGAGGNVGTAAVARATLLHGSGRNPVESSACGD